MKNNNPALLLSSPVPGMVTASPHYNSVHMPFSELMDSAWMHFEKSWIGNKTIEASDSDSRQFEHHPLIVASTMVSHSCIGVIDIQRMQYTYLSPNFEEFIGTSDKSYLHEGVKWVFSRIHPDDINGVLLFSELINKYLKGLPDNGIASYHSCWDFRVKAEGGEYFRILQQDCVLKYDAMGGVKELMFVADRIENVISAASQHLKLTDGTQSFFYSYNQANESLTRLEPLSKREIEIAKLIAKSRSLKQIAFQLGISFNTVKVHSANMMRKLMVNDSIEMISLLRTWGFI